MVRAKYLMRKITSIQENTEVREIIFKLMSSGLPGVPVVNGNHEIVGVVTEFDLMRAIQAGNKADSITAGNIMSKKLITAGLETTQDELINVMLENHLTIVPIIRGNKLAGIVSRFEIIDAYVDPDDYKWIIREQKEECVGEAQQFSCSRV